MKSCLPWLFVLAAGTTAQTTFAPTYATPAPTAGGQGGVIELRGRENDGAPSRFGRATATNGDILVVGAPDEVPLRGYAAAYRSDGSQVGPRFNASFGGRSVGVATVAGRPVVAVDAAFSDVGDVDVYALEGGDSWIKISTVQGGDIPGSFDFGVSLAFNDDGNGTVHDKAIVVGASGSSIAWIYQYDPASDDWTEWDIMAGFGPGCDRFGASVAYEKDVVVVGAPDAPCQAGKGAVHIGVPVPPYGFYEEVAMLEAEDGMMQEYFGTSVAVDDNLLVVGAPEHPYVLGSGFLGAGAVYVFRTPEFGRSWVQVAKITASDARPGDRFGSAVDIVGSTIAVGAEWAPGIIDPSPYVYRAGAAYIFKLDDKDSWFEVAKYAPPGGGKVEGHFGASVSLSSDFILVGASAPADSPLTTGDGIGLAYIFPL